jgi:L-alanine-DL-glutamate epimerase-like enolase superfamily enzyme
MPAQVKYSGSKSNLLRIDKITLYHGTMPVSCHFSYGSATSWRYCIAVVAAGGTVGYGEALHADVESAKATARKLLGRDALSLDALLPDAPFTWQGSVIREMFSMALHDLTARSMKTPLAFSFGAGRRERVPLMPCIFPQSSRDAAEAAGHFVEQGFLSLKVKLFGETEGDCSLVRSIRSIFPQGYLQADVNGGYKTLARARVALPRLFEAGLDVVEDPADIPLEEYSVLLELDQRPRIMLDAPTRGAAALAQVIRLRSCEIVNLHPNMQGTFSEIKERIAVLRQAGIEMQIGGTGYTGVGAFAHLQLASALESAFPYGEIGGWLDHGMPCSTASSPLPIENGHALVPSGPGHGGLLNEAYLREHAAITEIATH